MSIDFLNDIFEDSHLSDHISGGGRPGRVPLRPKPFKGIYRPGKAKENLSVFIEAAKMRRNPGPRSFLRPAGSGQEHLGGYHRRGDGCEHPHHLRPRY